MKIRNLFIIITTLILTACGGGDNSNSSPTVNPTAQITDTQQAATAVSATASERTASGFIDASAVAFPFQFAAGLSQGLFQPNNSRSGMQLVQANFCTTGTVSIPPANATSGIITFSDCEMGGLGIYLNGSIGFSATASGSVTNITMTYIDFTISDATQILASLSGVLSMSLSYDGNIWSSTVSTSGFSVTIDGETVRMDNYSITSEFDSNTNEDSVSFEYAVTSDLLGGTLIVTTDPAEGGAPLMQTFGDAFPYSGIIIIIGADNNRIRITINGGMATDSIVIEYALDSDGVYDDGMETISWAEFDALARYALNPVLK